MLQHYNYKLISLFLIILMSVSSVSTNDNPFLNTTKEFPPNFIFPWSPPPSLDGTVGEPLILTPFIKSRQITKALNKAQVKFENFENILSYSGFLTVNPRFNNNLFFWFFPAEINPETAPLLVWFNGGPGSPSLIGLFIEHGPFIVKGEPPVLNLRPVSWTKTLSIIYLDSPVGSGFSFTDPDERGYARTEEDVANDLYEFLLQFFQLFPDYKSRDFYITGQSFAGMYAIALGRKIHLENQNEVAEVKINFRGMALGNAWIDPITVLHYGTFYYNLGLIDLNQRRYFQQEEARGRKLIREKKYAKALKVMDKMVIGAFHRPTYLKKVTGFSFAFNFLSQYDYFGEDAMFQFLKSASTRRAIHPWLEELLDVPGQPYKILLYTGQLDLAVPSVATDRLIRNLNWNGAKKFLNSSKIIWKVPSSSQIAGYVKTSGSLTKIVVRNAGHGVPFDQPEWAYDMISRFTSGQSFN